ncbi:translation initiation factor IF-2-like [Equus quagga]|uniref:translation initiation factor IF-2-like n=1 Tax=Equus quagga TaxID=89248 RepID=UPI001EE36F62|nr:translation initiation factor IF-2-like [Equus quagga]
MGSVKQESGCRIIRRNLRGSAYLCSFKDSLEPAGIRTVCKCAGLNTEGARKKSPRQGNKERSFSNHFPELFHLISPPNHLASKRNHQVHARSKDWAGLAIPPPGPRLRSGRSPSVASPPLPRLPTTPAGLSFWLPLACASLLGGRREEGEGGAEGGSRVAICGQRILFKRSSSRKEETGEAEGGEETRPRTPQLRAAEHRGAGGGGRAAGGAGSGDTQRRRQPEQRALGEQEEREEEKPPRQPRAQKGQEDGPGRGGGGGGGGGGEGGRGGGRAGGRAPLDAGFRVFGLTRSLSSTSSLWTGLAARGPGGGSDQGKPRGGGRSSAGLNWPPGGGGWGGRGLRGRGGARRRWSKVLVAAREAVAAAARSQHDQALKVFQLKFQIGQTRCGFRGSDSKLPAHAAAKLQDGARSQAAAAAPRCLPPRGC